jgi:hypothetical protein
MFPRYSGWLDHGAISFRAEKESIILATADERLAAICESRPVDDSLVPMILSSLPIGHWHIRQAEALISFCSIWSNASLLFSENQVLVQPEGKVGLDATTFGQYEGPRCQIALNLAFLARFLGNGFHSFDVRQYDRGTRFLLARMRIYEESRLLDVENRTRAEEVIGLISCLTESGGALQVFPRDVSGPIQ